MDGRSFLQGAGCRLQVAGWNLIITGKPLALKRNVQVVDLPWLLHDPFTIAQKGGFRPSAKPTEAMGGEYIPMILSLQWVIVFEETSEISSEISAEFGFFPVSTKMKAHWACASIFRRLKSYIISFLYLFASFVIMAIFCCWGKTRAKSGIDGNICGAAIQMALKRFHWSQRVNQ